MALLIVPAKEKRSANDEERTANSEWRTALRCGHARARVHGIRF
jgi:hypothetical protein